jgi:Electron transfer DM13
MLTTGLGVVLALTLASCNSVSTETINDQLPSGTQNNPPATTPPGTTPVTTPPVTEAITRSSGVFVSVHHPTTGTAKLIKLTDGSFIARLEGFQTDNGPDVHVWVSQTSTISDVALRASPYTDLGTLKSTNGNQNYVIPSSVDVSQIKSIVIWCKAANIAFGGAALN